MGFNIIAPYGTYHEKTDLFGVQNIVMSCRGESVLKVINQGSIFLNGCRISGHFDTKSTAVVVTEPILHMFEDLKIAIFFQPRRGLFSRDLHYIWIVSHINRSLHHCSQKCINVLCTKEP